MGQTALETTLNELKKKTFIANYFLAGQVIYDICGLCRIAQPYLADLFTTVHSGVWRRLQHTLSWAKKVRMKRTHT